MTIPIHIVPGRHHGVWLLLALLAGAPPASALDYQYHGFASQGFVLSEGNNMFGDSTEGSFKLYEAGLNGTVSLRPELLASAQLLVRDAGASDNEGLRLDYALLDYQFHSTATSNAGIRVGRVKNAFGLFNETRDVVFARPGITLPQSVYFESFGFRRILFSSDGGQLHGGITHGDHYTSLTAAASVNRSASDDEKNQLLSPGARGDIDFKDFVVARLQDEVDGGNWRFALSYLQTTLDVDADVGVPLIGEFDIQLYVLSVRHDAEHYALTAEYSLMDSKGQFTGQPAFSSKGDGAYVQLDYRLHPQWTVSGRYDATFSNRNDRSGREFADSPENVQQADRHSRFALDSMVSLSWRPDEHWGVWGEFHLIDGTSSVSAADNPGRTPEKHWNSLLLMASYRF